MTMTVSSVQGGPQITVNQFIKNPLLIPARVLDLLANMFLAEAILRNAGSNGSRLISFEESTPLYLDGEVKEIAEFGEIPVAAGQVGLPRIVMAIEQALAVRISRQMRDENAVDQVNRQLKQLRNTFLRANNVALQALFTNPAIPTIAAGAAWDTANGRPRTDLAKAQEVIAAQSASGTVNGDDNQGFEADTIVLPGAITPVLMDNENFLKVYKDGLSNEDIRYTGKLPGQVMGMDAMRTRGSGWQQTRVLVLERNTVGFYSDPRPLESTGVYGEGNGPNGGPTQSFRSDSSQVRGMGLDQPKAACWITGVVTP